MVQELAPLAQGPLLANLPLAQGPLLTDQPLLAPLQIRPGPRLQPLVSPLHPPPEDPMLAYLRRRFHHPPTNQHRHHRKNRTTNHVQTASFSPIVLPPTSSKLLDRTITQTLVHGKQRNCVDRKVPKKGTTSPHLYKRNCAPAITPTVNPSYRGVSNGISGREFRSVSAKEARMPI